MQLHVQNILLLQQPSPPHTPSPLLYIFVHLKFLVFNAYFFCMNMYFNLINYHYSQTKAKNIETKKFGLDSAILCHSLY